MASHALSQAAQRFLAQSKQQGLIELPDRDNIKRLRKEINEGFHDASKGAWDRYITSTKESRVGGIDCLDIQPKHIDKNRNDVVMYYLFGGGYIVGSPEEDLPISGMLGNAVGVRVICPRYRLAPEHPFPAALEDSLNAYRALVERYDKVIVVGESAGGHLALQTVLGAYQENLKLPIACALMSPWADISLDGDSLCFNRDRDPTLSVEWIARAASLFAPDMNHRNSLVSPALAEYPSSFPATFLSTGTRDLLMSSSVSLSRQMRQSNIETQLSVWEDMWHVFEFYPDIPEGYSSLSEIAAFLINKLNS